jgi:NADH:ubiquinone oxidoreductase 27 kD subunit
MNEITKQAAENAVAKVLGAGFVHWTSDANGNAFGWVKLCDPMTLRGIAPNLAEIGARLMAITAYRNDKFGRMEGHEIAYHFDLDGVVVTVTTCLHGAPLKVPSITPWFKNADWHEREFAELYDIEVEDHPNPRRLFLDSKLDAGILDRLIPLSTMMNGASTTTLWEKVYEGRQLPEWAQGEKN